MVSDFTKGRYNLIKIYVGIDIAKLNHFAAAISSDGEIIIVPFKFTNDADGFQLLVSKLESFDKNSIISLELTAHYGVFCKHFLDKVAKHFWTLLQVQIGQSCKASTGSYPASRIAIADHI